MIYRTIWVSIYSLKCFKTVWSGLFTSTLFSPCSHRLEVWNGMLLKVLHILITAMYSKDWKWISKTVNCISCLVVCKIVFSSKFPNIPDNTREEWEGKGEEYRQLQSVMYFTQTQKDLVNIINYLWNWELEIESTFSSKLIMLWQLFYT